MTIEQRAQEYAKRNWPYWTDTTPAINCKQDYLHGATDQQELDRVELENKQFHIDRLTLNVFNLEEKIKILETDIAWYRSKQSSAFDEANLHYAEYKAQLASLLEVAGILSLRVRMSNGQFKGMPDDWVNATVYENTQSLETFETWKINNKL